MRPHGTRSRYVDGCRCDRCREANRLYYHQRKRHGTDLIDAGEARRIIQRLRNRGVGIRRLAHLTGLRRSTLQNIAAGRTRRVHPDTLRRLTDTFPIPADSTLVDATETLRRVKWLLTHGVTKRDISQHLGHRNPRSRLQIAKRGQVHRRTAQAIADLYFQHQRPEPERGPILSCRICGTRLAEHPIYPCRLTA